MAGLPCIRVSANCGLTNLEKGLDHPDFRPRFHLFISAVTLQHRGHIAAGLFSSPIFTYGIKDIMILRPFLLLAACLLSFVRADVEVTGPEAGDTITGLKLSITWKDSGTAPALSDLASYQLFLCAGGNSESNYVRLQRQFWTRFHTNTPSDTISDFGCRW